MPLDLSKNQSNLPDPYPSRLTEGERWIDRVDPIVWPHVEGAPFSDVLPKPEIAAYGRDGYLVRRNVFSADEVRALVEAATRLRETAAQNAGEDAVCEPGSDELRTLFNLETHAEIFDMLSRSRQVAGVARRLLGDDVYIHQSRLNYKPGFTGKEFYWHSDFETWHAEDGMPRMRAVSASILLTDNSALNGPLMLMPGSHKIFIGCQGETPAEHHKSSLKKQEIGAPSKASLTRLAETCGVDYAAGPAGTVIFFDCNTMHGSNGNITPFPRSNAFFVFNAVSNALTAPFGATMPRPEFLARRSDVAPIKTHDEPITPAEGLASRLSSSRRP